MSSFQTKTAEITGYAVQNNNSLYPEYRGKNAVIHESVLAHASTIIVFGYKKALFGY